MRDSPESPSDEPLRRNRDFSTLLVSQSVSAAGDAVSATAMPLLVLALTGSGLAMGIPAAFGLTLTGLGVGTLIGSLFATRLGHGTNVARVLVLAVLLMGAPFIAAAAIGSLPVIVAMTALSGAGEAVLVVVYVSVRAANSPDALVGRIASTARVMALGLMPIGSLVGGVLIDTIRGTGTLAVLGASLCTVALVFSQVRGLRAASLAPPHPEAREPVLPVSEGIEL